MITFIITSSLELQPLLIDEVKDDFFDTILETRKQQYINSIPKIIEFAKSIQATVIVVENNKPRPTIFDTLDCQVLYTDTNQYMNTKGTNELLDILACLHTFQIPEDELIVKVTGRYLLDVSGSFCSELKAYDPEKTDCILRYGSYVDTRNDQPHEDCLTGLIAMKCKYIKEMKHDPSDCVEWSWAKKSLELDPNRVNIMKGKIGYRMYSWNTKEITYVDL
jgi:hypothetical protein